MPLQVLCSKDCRSCVQEAQRRRLQRRYASPSSCGDRQPSELYGNHQIQRGTPILDVEVEDVGVKISHTVVEMISPPYILTDFQFPSSKRGIYKLL
jgi:hypothetical protein